MSEAVRHPGDDLQLLIDGRLDPVRRAEVESHLAGCARCRAEVAALRDVKGALREELPRHPVPPELAARVARTLDAEVARRRRGWRQPALLGASALAAAAVLLLVLTRGGPRDFVEAAARDFADVGAGTLQLDLETSEPAELERRFAGAGIAFPTRVFDFGMMGYELVGGAVDDVGGRRSALFVYRGRGGERVVCQMYPGRVSELPPAARSHEHNGITFLVYIVEGVTLVFWQEGTVVCVLASDGDPNEAIALAHAKAVRV
jgi:anti-sigma factor RsiW